MSREFPRSQVDDLLKACHRRCCICHRFCGVKIETDHIIPRSEQGPDTIDNAIPVCFECHAEIHSYNDKHPRGRKFHPDELRAHKDQWLEICKTKPEIFVSATRDFDVGPLQALIDEMEFNLEVSRHPKQNELGCIFHDEQFRRAIKDGAIAMLKDDLKKSILEAYRVMGRATQQIHRAMLAAKTNQIEARDEASSAIRETSTSITNARNSLLGFLGSDQ